MTRKRLAAGVPHSILWVIGAAISARALVVSLFPFTGALPASFFPLAFNFAD